MHDVGAPSDGERDKNTAYMQAETQAHGRKWGAMSQGRMHQRWGHWKSVEAVALGTPVTPLPFVTPVPIFSSHQCELISVFHG